MEIIIFPALSIGFRPRIFVQSLRVRKLSTQKQKTHSGCEWVESFFLLISLTETPPATWLYAK